MLNLTEIAGINLNNIHPGTFDAVFIRSLTLPKDPLNCEELCKCLSCGHGKCENNKDQDKCPKGTQGFICRCSNSKAYPTFKQIIEDMLKTNMACRTC